MITEDFTGICQTRNHGSFGVMRAICGAYRICVTMEASVGVRCPDRFRDA